MQHSAWYKVRLNWYLLHIRSHVQNSEGMQESAFQAQNKDVEWCVKIALLAIWGNQNSVVYKYKKLEFLGSPVVRIHACTATSTGSIPGQGTTIPQVACSGAKIKGLGWTPKPPPYTHTGTLGTYPKGKMTKRLDQPYNEQPVQVLKRYSIKIWKTKYHYTIARITTIK